MMDLQELHTSGWTCVNGISSRADLLELGRAVGCPVPGPNGELVRKLRPTRAAEAIPGSQSAIYGTGPFPLHTDTVFWPLPVRYTILRAYGDRRRPTTVLSFAELFCELGVHFSGIAERSVWLVHAGPKRFYCSFRFRSGDLVGSRYDCDCMYPANSAAAEVDRLLRPLVAGASAACITWSSDMAVVLSNWRVLHGRGPGPSDEGPRIVERLYVR
jgi:alpha-ketoglutarate-dependent taurine dioxygenase